MLPQKSCFRLRYSSPASLSNAASPGPDRRVRSGSGISAKGGKRTLVWYRNRMYRDQPERVYPPAWRVILAFVITPGVAAVLMASVMAWYDGLSDPAERIWTIAFFLALFGTYPTAVFVGIPAYFILRRYFALTPINCMAAGAFVGTWPGVALGLLPLVASQASVDGRGWLSGAEFVLLTAGFGFVAGLVFWAVAAAGHDAAHFARP